MDVDAALEIEHSAPFEQQGAALASEIAQDEIIDGVMQEILLIQEESDALSLQDGS